MEMELWEYLSSTKKPTLVDPFLSFDVLKQVMPPSEKVETP